MKEEPTVHMRFPCRHPAAQVRPYPLDTSHILKCHLCGTIAVFGVLHSIVGTYDCWVPVSTLREMLSQGATA